MKILLIGMQYVPNQYTRAIESYGFEYVHISGDPTGRLPEGDAAIFAISQMSHGKYWRAKEYCKEENIPMFFTYNGFSDIKEEFEKWVISTNEAVIRKGVSEGTTVAAAFKAAALAEKTKKLEKPKEQATMPDIKSPAYRAGVNEITLECFKKGIRARQTVDLLVSRGFPTTLKGTPWTDTAVHTKFYFYRQKGIGSDSPTSQSPKQPRTAKNGSAQLDLIAKVLGSKQEMARKLELIEEIQAGLLMTENQVRAIREGEYLKLQRRNILAEEDSDLVMLDKVTAAAIIDSIQMIEAFLNEG